MHIPAMNLEIERIYAKALAAGQRTLAVTAANPGEGTTSVALALAQRNLLAGHSTVVVDMNLHHPALQQVLDLPALPNSTALLNNPQLVGTSGSEIAVTGITVPSRRESLTKLRKPGVLEQCIDELLGRFDTVIFDTSSVNRVNANNIPAERVAAACDGTVLVVLAGRTSETMISTAVHKLNDAGAHITGCALNDRDNPALIDELLREVDRLPPRLARLKRWLQGKIRQTSLLALEI